jgi:CDP-paratose 2-epimerase
MQARRGGYTDGSGRRGGGWYHARRGCHRRWRAYPKDLIIPVAIVTGSGGLVGSEAVRHLVASGYDIIGVENDMRARLFGRSASTASTTRRLQNEYPGEFRSLPLDIRDADGVLRVVREHRKDLALVVHAAAQPSHDWAASDPPTDFAINANGTMNLLEAVRRKKPDATFVFLSTNKVYGDHPNRLPLTATETRLELAPDHEYFDGIGTSMPIDHCTHSLFGVSKVAADLMVQEYGRYFGMPTACFRGGCITGPAHAGAKLHGFLSYLMKCTITGEPYTIFGYRGKQVRDNIHSADVIKAVDAFSRNPKTAAVYNLGGGRESSVSVLEAIAMCERIACRELDYTFCDEARVGDHRWYISDISPFKRDYPHFTLSYSIEAMLREIHDANVEQWLTAGAA